MNIASNRDRKQTNNSTVTELSMSSMFKPHDKPLNQICSYYPHFSDEQTNDSDEKT